MAKIIGMGNNTPPKQPQQPKIDLNKSKPMVCNHCGSPLTVKLAECGQSYKKGQIYTQR